MAKIGEGRALNRRMPANDLERMMNIMTEIIHVILWADPLLKISSEKIIVDMVHMLGTGILDMMLRYDCYDAGFSHVRLFC